jgi:hypothetical protein
MITQRCARISAARSSLFQPQIFSAPALVERITQKSYRGDPQTGYALAFKLFMLVPVQRLFSMFPQGGPGAALLLFRVSVAAMFFIYSPHASGALPSHLLFAAGLLIIALLVIGFLTPISSVAICLFAIAGLLPPRHEIFPHVLLICYAASLAVLGPGAYSIDARLFGRRVLVVRPRKGPDAN